METMRGLVTVAILFNLSIVFARDGDVVEAPQTGSSTRAPASNCFEIMNVKTCDPDTIKRIDERIRNEARDPGDVMGIVEQELETERELSGISRRGNGSTESDYQRGGAVNSMNCKPNEKFTESGCVPDPNKNAGNPTPPTEEKPEDTVLLCSEAHAAAMESCNSQSQSWMGNINQVVDMAGPALAQAKPNATTCSGIAAASVGAKGSLATFAVMCNSASSNCAKACVGTDAQIATMAKECKAKATSAQQAQQRIQSAVQSLQASVATCQAAFGDINGQAQAHCQANPSACAINTPGGIAGSAIPADQAGGAMNPGLNSNGSGGPGGSGTGFNLNDIGADGEEGIGQIAPSKPGEDIGGAKGGAGVAGGGSGQGGDGGNGSGGKKEGLLSNILSGFFGGGGGSGGGGFKSWFGGGNKGDAYFGNQPKAGKGTPDLRQFLPGGANDPNRHRGIAGQFIGRDGMTGPHSDIWKNINNRYQNKRASLLP